MNLERSDIENLRSRIEDSLRGLNLHEVGLEYDAIIRDHPIVEIEVDFHAAGCTYYDIIEFWVDESDDQEALLKWVIDESKQIRDRKRDEDRVRLGE